MVASAVLTSKRWEAGPKHVECSWKPLRPLGIAVPILVVLQIGLGTAFRHNAMGVVWHILDALIVLAVAMVAGVCVLRQYEEHHSLRPAALALLIIVGVQVLLGFSVYLVLLMSSENNTGLIVTGMLHVINGSLTLAASVVLAMQMHRNPNTIIGANMLIYDLNANPLPKRQRRWAFPLTECFHITSFALSIGTIALVDLRLLGLAMKHQTPGQPVKDTGLWTLAGLIIVIVSGLLIFSSDPIRYLYNSGFQWKIAVLVLAIIYNYTIHRRVALSNSSPMAGKLARAMSTLAVGAGAVRRHLDLVRLSIQGRISMSVAEISHQIQSIGFLTYIRESGYTYPMILSTHLATICIFGGLILMTDLRILGWAMTDVSVTDVVGQLRRWKRIGFVIMVTMGLLLATSEKNGQVLRQPRAIF